MEKAASRSWKILRSRRPAKAAGRDSRRPMEAAHEIGEVAEADVIGDVGDGARHLRQQARRPPQPRADKILVRRHPQHAREEPQEMKRAEPGLRRRALEIDGIPGMGIDPECGRYGTAAIQGAGGQRFALAPGNGLDEARSQ